MTPKSPTRPSLWKGKAKATSSSLIDPEFIDLEPVITYRHVLSNNLDVKDPLRVIALCDSDAFYAACEMVRLNVDNETPLVVLQWDSLIAVNYPARKYGITRMMKVKEALKKCPHLKIIHVATYKEGDREPGYWEDVDTNTHKVSLDYYRRESVKIAAKFKESLPASVEIGEAFLVCFILPGGQLMFHRNWVRKGIY
jgi:DNA polymerase eta